MKKETSSRGKIWETIGMIGAWGSIALSLAFAILTFTESTLLFHPALAYAFALFALVSFVLLLLWKRLELGRGLHILLSVAVGLAGIAIFLALGSFLLLLFFA